MAFYGGAAPFGVAVNVTATIDPTAQQVNEFFGVSGQQALFGGERGVIILVSGVFFDLAPALVVDRESVLLSYRDGISRLFVDNQGRAYPNCIFDGPYSTWEHGIKPAWYGPGLVGGWAMAYRAAFRSLGA